ncbi:hypothetical protein PhCBS80983_g01737 [Powellomyces hirtus]|uniref:F-box domain-containing protein n=1 Tax=Powellomyces hirtus TaxID=109895 RepID=A0A507EBM5_9FUNG|nr:hypothetical protein PhCBS80983_g01737 [Powellomyces hirtus]
MSPTFLDKVQTWKSTHKFSPIKTKRRLNSKDSILRSAELLNSPPAGSNDQLSSECITTASSVPPQPDFLPGLPSHLAFFILQHLPVEDVVNCCRVCRTWNREALHPILWQRFCMDAGILFGPGIEHILLERCGDDTLLWWKEVYRDGITRRINWERGKYELLTVPLVDIRDSINCFWFDGDKMVIGTRRHRLSVFHIPSPSTWTTLAARDDPKPVTPDVTFHPGHSVPIMAIGLPDQAGPVSHLLASVDGSGALILWNVFTGAIIANVPTAHNGGIAGVAIIDGGRRIVTAGFDRILRVHEIRLDEEEEEPDEALGPLPDDQSSQGSSSGVSRTGSISSAANAGKQLLGTSFGVQSGDTASVMSRTSSLRTGHTASISGSLPRDASIRSGKSIRDSPSASSRRRANHSDPGRPPSGKKRGFASSTSPPPPAPASGSSPSKGKQSSSTAARLALRVISTERPLVPPPPLKYRLRAKLDKLRHPRHHSAAEDKSTSKSNSAEEVQDSAPQYSIVCTQAIKGHSGDIYCMAVMPDENIAVTGSMDHTVKVWDLEANAMARSMRGHTDSVTCLCVRDEYVFSGSLDKTIRQWDTTSGRCTRTLMGHTKWVKTMAVDDRMLISGGWDEVILVWDWKQGTLLHSLPINHGPIVCLQFDETKIAAVCRGDGYQHHITILDFGSKRIEPLVVKSEQEEQEKSVSQRVLADPEAAEKEGGEEVPVAG